MNKNKRELEILSTLRNRPGIDPDLSFVHRLQSEVVKRNRIKRKRVLPSLKVTTSIIASGFLFLMLAITLPDQEQISTNQTNQLPPSKGNSHVNNDGPPLLINDKEVTLITFLPRKAEITKTVSNTKGDEKLIAIMENVANSSTSLLLDDDAKEGMFATMKFLYKDEEVESYFVWIEDDQEVVIGIHKFEGEEHVIGYQLTESESQDFLLFLQEQDVID